MSPQGTFYLKYARMHLITLLVLKAIVGSTKIIAKPSFSPQQDMQRSVVWPKV